MEYLWNSLLTSWAKKRDLQKSQSGQKGNIMAFLKPPTGEESVEAASFMFPVGGSPNVVIARCGHASWTRSMDKQHEHTTCKSKRIFRGSNGQFRIHLIKFRDISYWQNFYFAKFDIFAN
jgi:hypothetical protein